MRGAFLERDQPAPDVRETRIIIRPNQSLSRRGAFILFACLAAPTLAVGVVFHALGYVLVLPFSGFDVAALGAALWTVMLRAEQREIVSMDRDKVVVERGRSRPAWRCEFPSAWVRAALEQASMRNHPSRLLLRSHGREIEIGSMLTEPERSALASALARTLPLERRPAPASVRDPRLAVDPPGGSR